MPVTEGRIERWLSQFEKGDRDLAARVLDVIDFLGNDQIAVAFRSSLVSIPGWERNAEQRRGRWYFIPFSSSGGESGDSMLYRFRTANNMGGRYWNSLFPRWSSLLDLAPGPEDTVVMIDDFSGTGDQACSAWAEVFRELLPFGPQVFLVLVAASRRARERIRANTDLIPQPHFELTERDDFFDRACDSFTEQEKEVLLRYCSIADPQNPRGHGECGYVVVLAHKTPNNSIPILHARRQGWEGLFRRHD